jgi:hypothetical protein
MRTRALIVIAVAALALVGCGDHNLILKVDVLSYLDASQKTFLAGDLPVVGGPFGPLTILDNMTINLIDGLNDAADVKSVTLFLGGQTTVSSGSGSGRLKIYLSENAPDPLTDVPVMDVAVQLPGVVNASAAGSADVAKLFTQKNLHLTVVLDGVTITAPVTTLTVNLTKLDAVVIAGRKHNL